MTESTFVGPVGFVVFQFPNGADVSGGLAALLDQVNRGTLDLLDIECVRLNENEEAVSFPVTELSGLDTALLPQFDGADSHILDQEDLDELSGDLEPGQFAIAVVYEDLSLASVADAWYGVGGTETLIGGVDLNDLDAFLETGE